MTLGETAGKVKLQVLQWGRPWRTSSVVTKKAFSIQPLDAVISPREKVDLVKIDVEGHELAVFRGMRRILHEQQPPVSFECLPGSPSLEMEAVLNEAGYHLYHLRAGSAPIPIDGLDPENQDSHNFLALPRERHSWKNAGVQPLYTFLKCMLTKLGFHHPAACLT